MHDSFLAFRNRPFKWLFAITFMTTFAIFIHDTLVGYALYKMTKDPMTLGLMGLSEALPYIFISVFGGHIADKYNKKVVVGLAFLAILSSVGFVAYILSSTHLALAGKLTLIYLALIVGGFARGIFSPAKFALQTALTPRAQYTSAATWTSIAWQIGMVAGPAAFGFLHGKLQFTYLQTLYMVILLLLMSIFCLIFVTHV